VPALLALALAGCSTTAEKSARLERAAKAREAAHGDGAAAHGVSVKRASRVVKVTATAILHSSEGTAAAVTLHNTSARALRDVPIEIHVLDAHGRALYSNTVSGLGAPLTSLSALPAHATLTWVDDQIPAAGTPASVTAEAGEGAPIGGAVPRLSIAGTHAVEDPSNGPGAEGTVVNDSAITQRELVVFALARRGSRIVAAGRAVLPQAPARGRSHFQLFFIGSPRGAQLQFAVPASTLG
jgi:hypothetical protein